jgi:tryptophanyl-tRNA synthetase
MKYLVGVQPTGKLHIGNYLGCLAKGLRLQEEGHDVTFLIANYHSLTTSDNYCEATIGELYRLGCKKIVQQTPEYTEQFFKLCCKLNLGTLLRMPQYKDKKDTVEYDVGLLLYPVLMAADIMMNDPDVVIIGKDQVPHMELANDLGKRVGAKRYEYELGDVDKVMSLVNPTLKMSKSLGDNHVVYLFDENYEKKLRKANMDEQGMKNVKKIGDFFGVEYKGRNDEYKMEIAEKMKLKFV